MEAEEGAEAEEVEEVAEAEEGAEVEEVEEGAEAEVAAGADNQQQPQWLPHTLPT